MSPRTRRRRMIRSALRSSFRVVVSFAFFVATSPNGATIAEGAVSGGKVGKVDRAEIVKRADASTVKIKARGKAGKPREISNGAGVVISVDGYIITALHVIEGYPDIKITTVGGDIFPAKAIFVEATYDIAMIKADVGTEATLEVAPIADMQSVQSGKKVAIIGNPLGMGQSIVDGVLGGTAPVSWDGHKQTLQTVQGTVLKGNSGGGTFDLETGELLGINVAKSAMQKDLGYMVPVDRLMAIIDRKLPIVELADSHEIYNQLGVKMRPVKLIDGDYANGMLITSVKPGSAAAKAGWSVGDVLVGMGKYKMVSQDAVLYVLRDQANQGDQVNFLMARGDTVDTGNMSFDATAQAQAASVATQAELVGASH